jgi:hypothetical protein
MEIQNVTIEDAEELLDIYAPYVKDTAITFEYEVPSVEEFRKRIRNILKKYPYIVEEKEGEILGYAYAGVLPHTTGQLKLRYMYVKIRERVVLAELYMKDWKTFLKCKIFLI